MTTVDELLSQSPFYIAHRGSGTDYPEHTMAAYEAAVAAGAQAIEVSVCSTADGVLICHHDQTLDRVTDLTGPVSNYTYAQLKNLGKIKAQGLLGDGWEDQPFTLLDDVIRRFLGRVTIFLEPKTNPATDRLIEYIYTLDHDLVANYLVWKVYYTNNTRSWAQSHGMRTWAYIDAGTSSAQMDAQDATVDFWGVPHTATDSKIAEVVARGKPVIVWEVARRYERDRLVNLGVQGLMCPSILYVPENKQILTSDRFATQIKSPGDVGLENYSPTYALKYTPAGEAYFDHMDRASAVLGSLSLPEFPANGYRISFEQKYDALPSPTSLHGGIAFGKDSDDIFRQSTGNLSGGYHLAIRGSGVIDLLTHAPGNPNGTIIGSVTADAPVPGQWMSFEVDVTPTQVIVRRTDVEPDAVITSNNTMYRGGYVHLSGGTVTDPAAKPKWRNVSVVPL